MKCLLELSDLKKACQALQWATGQSQNPSLSNVTLTAGSSLLRLYQADGSNALTIAFKAEVQEAGEATVCFHSLRSLTENLITPALALNLSDRGLLFESEDGRVVLPLTKPTQEGPKFPKDLPAHTSAFLLNRVSRQVYAAAKNDPNGTLLLKFHPQTAALWIETFQPDGSCLARIAAVATETKEFALNAAKFAYFMRAATVWQHPTDARLLVDETHLHVLNDLTSFSLELTKTEQRLGGSYKQYEMEKPDLQLMRIPRAALVQILETCLASSPSKGLVRLDWIKHTGEDKLRLSCEGYRYQVVRYTRADGLVKGPAWIKAAPLLDFLKTYMNPIAEFEFGQKFYFVNLQKEVRFAQCLERPIS